MQVILGPNAKGDTELRDIYNRALGEASVLYIATAYLTDWDARYKMHPQCKQVVFLVGTDFGLTRKAALRGVLHWLPRQASCFFGAVPIQNGGFHPKIVAWQTHSGKHFCVIGSSNLSKAAFSGNYEANVFAAISSGEFERIRVWLDLVSEGACPVSEDWIEHHYKEAKTRSKRRGVASSSSFQIKPSDLPHGSACAQNVRKRRRDQSAFAEIAKAIRGKAVRCAQGTISRGQFWEAFWELWAHHASRFQGSGIQFTGKSAKWEEACSALIRILDTRKSSSVSRIDRAVVNEIDNLKEQGNPMRGAWLSEMLCHYFPDLYPIDNMPVKRWLSSIKLRGRRGASEGQRYVDLARKLRAAVQNHHPAGARNLAELDGAIWQWAYDHGLLRPE